jgi:hypothetical protein
MMVQAERGPVVIVGARGGTNVAESLYRGAQDAVIKSVLCDIDVSMSKSRHINALCWRLRDRQAPFPGRLAQTLSKLLATELPCALISVGLAAIERPTIEAWRAAGVPCLHYSTDDPWSPSLRARWHFDALQAYDIVFTPRKRNLDDLIELPCRHVVYLPFGYDPHLLTSQVSAQPDVRQAPALERSSEPHKVTSLFVGGADESRAQFFREFIKAGGDVVLVGGYWGHWPELKHRWLGHLSPSDVLALTRSACLNIILVRRSNRDGHTMRTFEASAMGGCLLVEDTPEHRNFFGDDGDTVRYFSTAAEAASTQRELILRESERLRLAQAVTALIRGGHHTYGDRLKTMLSSIATDNAPTLSAGR